ncbi:uncharacterized protein AC631_00849 [Debaryomyces fabryi]|uniref:Uncharacterized protein n=1 Tax=Debaryomyces fabryi TaxID=58627 RepID=A0A0V1Q4B4_9ASCO|nr:uncharacterized protein AC631_00849 [Debaryomyces fabryi]KSA03364.1 hypothetical protein AC631_00849 [Debaryomyces fabryi]CUM49935.1 unnamed protein product [Debaryomyces fabryi]
MNSFQSNHISQSPFLKPSSSRHFNTPYGLNNNKENYSKFSSICSNPSIRRDILPAECIHAWETSLDKELNKILRETLNGPNKENRNNTLVDHSIRKLKELYDARDELDIFKLLLTDIAELLSLEIPNIETKNRAVGNYSIPQFLELVETNHLLMTKVNEMQKAINIFNIKKSVVIDRMQKRLENTNLTSIQEVPSCNQTVDSDWKEFNSTNRITKQEKLDNIDESLNLSDSLNSESDTIDG